MHGFPRDTEAWHVWYRELVRKGERERGMVRDLVDEALRSGDLFDNELLLDLDELTLTRFDVTPQMVDEWIKKGRGST